MANVIDRIRTVDTELDPALVIDPERRKKMHSEQNAECRGWFASACRGPGAGTMNAAVLK